MATRQIKDAKDLTTNELIYFKSHAKATYMSDGLTVEEAINIIKATGGAYDEVNHGTNDTTFALTPNTFHVWDEVTSLDLSFADEQAGVANEYLFQFTSGATATTLTLPDVKWANDNELLIAENKIYQISVLKGLGSVLEFTGELIMFSVNGTQYFARANMTWRDWVGSAFNTDGFVVYNEKIANSSLTQIIKDISLSDVITINGSYPLDFDGGVGPT